MEIINKVLYWISTGLMLPVILILIFLFAKSLLAIGSFYGLYINRLKTNKDVNRYLKNLSENGIYKSEPFSKSAPIYDYYKRIFVAQQSPINREKVLTDFELEMNKILAPTKNMAKLGPILGLMGTLIPMGPALVGLASGNIASMAENMQVAFSTTVIGLVVGALGYLLTEIKKRWFASDLSNLTYVVDIYSEANETKKE